MLSRILGSLDGAPIGGLQLVRGGASFEHRHFREQLFVGSKRFVNGKKQRFVTFHFARFSGFRSAQVGNAVFAAARRPMVDYCGTLLTRQPAFELATKTLPSRTSPGGRPKSSTFNVASPGRVEDWRRCSVGPAYPFAPRFRWECLTNRTVNWFPAPATSHVAGGFPALRAPAHFTLRFMRRIRPGRLPR